MRIHPIGWCLLAALGSLAGGCASEGAKPAGAAANAPAVLALTEADSGTTVTAKRGQQIVVTLGSNPSTGYRWAPPLVENIAVVKLVSTKYNPPGSGRMGAAGTEEWVFAATGPGTASISLTYARPFAQQDNPTRYTFTVQVK